MDKLSKLTNTPKSTILFYIKEQLLPEPEKPKPNLHLYDESCIETIEFIKYLQHNFNSSIDEIRAIMHDRDFNLKSGFQNVLSTLNIIMGSTHQKTYSDEYVYEHYDITQEKLYYYLQEELLFKRDGLFTSKDLDILKTLIDLERVGIDMDILKTYVKHARKLAQIEVEYAKDFLKKADNTDKAVKALFDTTLILKPYLFNMHTVKSYQKSEGTS